ncbi:zinc finger protein [Plasmodium brasilianum]|uniref:Zinc finger protein, putative n=2 Tax=Plasmodium (Plasmodium) TaxID=418103 RepID=A0A1A8WA41_PLAMA|nr:zinc finger protein, putative [Plasmodium malariae]KAI4835841.1 zinc finger protein [Plasmodium brasilianum]SBS89712.1 zinc finger protein, putative [Plasmodium malariae]SBT72385.1 zinc finger protein, putative [Plasmodium malariae]SCP02778.1 zinc finger protein, putative [Plasmodium malariae]
MGRKRLDKNAKNVKKRKRKKGSDSEDDDDIEITNINVNLNRNASSLGKFKQREKLDINLILAQDEADASKIKSYCWTKVSGGSSSLTRRKFCIVCGFEGKYKCLKCYEHKPISYIRYYCSLNCKKIHDESSCCKYKMLDMW